MEIEVVVLVNCMGYYIGFENIIIIVQMAVLDHYAWGYAYFTFDDPNRIGNVLDRRLPWD